METYREMKERHQQEVNALPVKFAFSKEQFNDMCKSWGFAEDDAPNMIYHGGGGMYYLKKDDELIRDTFWRCHAEEFNAMTSDFDFAVQAFEYEMYNHEYPYSMDCEDVISSLGLNWEDFDRHSILGKAFDVAEKIVMKWEG